MKSIITSPDSDPHEYEATPGDARTVASARYVIYNGLGYDPWVDKFLAASPAPGRVTLKVQALLGLGDDDNPHRWYSPSNVSTVIDRLTSDFKKLEPDNAAYFDQQRADLLSNRMAQYFGLVQQIKQRYPGAKIAATESIVSPLADALGLDLVTPYSFLSAISEGTDPTAQDKATFDDQIAHGTFVVLLFNTQNATPDVQRLVDKAEAKGIAIVDVTETLDPPTVAFQEWQVRQLQDLASALAKATSR